MSVAVRDSMQLQSLVDEQIGAWRSGGEPNAAGFLAEHPELESNKSLVLDLVLEEYCLRAAAGDTLVKSTFCERFPAYRQSVAKMIEFQELLDQCPEFAIRRQQLPWPRPGERFLGYDLVEQLGSGALARVYLAREPALGQRLVVVKVSRFGTYEAETLGKLSHPNIVPIHSVQHDSATGWTAICMPLLGTATAVDLLDAAFAAGQPQGGDVIARIGATARPIAGIAPAVAADESRQWRGPYADAIARLGLQLADGLQVAHAAGVRHHDIKPSNVLLAWSGRPMLLDFNLSNDIDASIEKVGGTLEYIAPEMIASWLDDQKRATLRLDPRCDIYSLGAVLYQLLTGKLPTNHSDADKPRLKSKLQPPPPLRTINPAIDPRLEAIVLKCLALDPAERYATAADLVAELQTHLSLPQAARRYISRHRRGFLAAGAALAAGAVSGGAYVSSLKPYPERLLDRGLADYDRGDYGRALETLDLCIEQRREWHEARFARGQTLRQLQRWNDARLDFATLIDVHPSWMNALVGFCHMRSKKDDAAAAAAYAKAHAAGVRDLRFLLNHADVCRRRQRFYEGIAIYTEVIERDPDIALAYRGRAFCQLWYANRQNQNRKRDLVQPAAQAFEDSRADIRLSHGSCESYFMAAQVFGYAVRCDPALEDLSANGAGYLKLALERGLTHSSFKNWLPFLRPLVNAEIEELVARAPAGGAAVPFEPFPQQELPFFPRWDAFLEAVGESHCQANSLR